MPKCDFSQRTINGIQYYGVIGKKVGMDYIFYWDDDNIRKLVLTNYWGEYMKCGFLTLPDFSWKEHHSWGKCEDKLYTLENCINFPSK